MPGSTTAEDLAARDDTASRQHLIDLLRREGRQSGVWFAGHLLTAADQLEAYPTPKPAGDADAPAVSSPDWVGEEMSLPETAAMALMYLNTGFIECEQCGHEMPTKRLDATYALQDALAALPSTPPAADAGEVERLREALAEVLPYLEQGYMDDGEDDEPIGWCADADGTNQRPLPLTFGMIRRARAALAPRDHGEAGK